MAEINFLRIVSMPFDENTYVLYKEGLTSCVVVDPGLEPEKIVEVLQEKKLEVAAILNTHGHSDHIAGNATIKELAPSAPLVIGWGDAEKLTDPDKNLSAPFGLPFVSPQEDITVKEADVYHAAEIDFEVRETPGHSKGHVVFIVRDGDRTIVLGGDVLFKGSVGRSDFPDGSFADLKRSIEEKLFTLPTDSVVLPGHGPATTVGEEIESNPFVGRAAGYRG
ncbi:MBL fold metallo-hydrolase [Bremerella cremea]|uniref:MBL fold metallo-hydrolase n=1 Tax=Bremerella cremea TaxID=1031537 RepID=A0A368KW88_9BACT|nr:MBL fold metallo-hydrolase [Bremerella cremea]RCS54596.1 MBL fold metallo-hydrolase [Bremerella cremea]